MNLVNQPTAAPSRKVWAAIVTAMIVGGAQSALAVVVPEADFGPIAEIITPMLSTGLVVLAAYMRRDAA